MEKEMYIVKYFVGSGKIFKVKGKLLYNDNYFIEKGEHRCVKVGTDAFENIEDAKKKAKELLIKKIKSMALNLGKLQKRLVELNVTDNFEIEEK